VKKKELEKGGLLIAFGRSIGRQLSNVGHQRGAGPLIMRAELIPRPLLALVRLRLRLEVHCQYQLLFASVDRNF
jgi:hypothetical protein